MTHCAECGRELRPDEIVQLNVLDRTVTCLKCALTVEVPCGV